jgi:hypothetical protein
MFLAESFCPAPLCNTRSQMRCHEAARSVQTSDTRRGDVSCGPQLSVLTSGAIFWEHRQKEKVIRVQDTKPSYGTHRAVSTVQTSVVGKIQLYSVHDAERFNYTELYKFVKHTTCMLCETIMWRKCIIFSIDNWRPITTAISLHAT